jgi:hypothetical protein
MSRLVEMMESTRRGITTQRATGAAAIAVTIAPTKKWQLHEIRLHLDAAGGAGDLTVTIDSGVDPVYDTVIATQDMTSVTDYYWQPNDPIKFSKTDELDIAWANANTKTYGIEIIYSRV